LTDLGSAKSSLGKLSSQPMECKLISVTSIQQKPRIQGAIAYSHLQKEPAKEGCIDKNSRDPLLQQKKGYKSISVMNTQRMPPPQSPIIDNICRMSRVKDLRTE
jgi:hypothetical protein